MKKFIKFFAFVSVILCLFASTVSADFKKDHPVTVTDAEGKQLELFVTGDEFVSVLHDSDGYVMIDTEFGHYEYGKLENGEIVPCGSEPSLKFDQIPETYFIEEREKVITAMEAEGLVIPGRGVELFSAGGTVKEFKGTGTVIVVPIAFNGGSSDFAGLTQNVENACDYFNEVSYGKLSLDYIDVSEGRSIYVSPREEGYYHARSYSNLTGYSDDDQRVSRENALVKGALAYYGLAEKTTDSCIDVNGDGANDFLVFVYNTKIDPVWNALLWPHQMQYTRDKYNVYGKGVRSWIFVPRSANKATLCHEMYHAIGAPDLYGYTDNYNYVGMWDLMDGGNGTMLTYMKYHYGGWIDEIPEITSEGRYTLNPACAEEGNCYKIPINDTEYYVIEYRNRYSGRINYLDKWRQWCSEGLLVTRVNANRTGYGNMEASQYGTEVELVMHSALGVNTILGTALPEFSSDGGFDRKLASGEEDEKTVIKNIKENADGTLSFDVSFDGEAQEEYEPLDNHTVRASFEYDSYNRPYCKLTVYKVKQDSGGNQIYTLADDYDIKYVFITGAVSSANSVEYLDYDSSFPLKETGIVLAYIVDSQGKLRGELYQVRLHYSLPGINTANSVRSYEYNASMFSSGAGSKITGIVFDAGEKYVGKLNMDELIRFDVDGVEYQFLSQDVQGSNLVFDADTVGITAEDGSEVYMKGLYYEDYDEKGFVKFECNRGRKSIFENAMTVSPGGGIFMSVPGNFDGDIRYTTDGSMPSVESTLYTAPITVESDMVIRAITIRNGEIVESNPVRVYAQEDYREYNAKELNSIFKNSGTAFFGGEGKYIKIAYTPGEGTLILRDSNWFTVEKVINPEESGVMYIDATSDIYVSEASGDNIRISVVDSINQIDLTILEDTDAGTKVAMHNFGEDAEFSLVAASYTDDRMENAAEKQVAVASGATGYEEVSVSGENMKAFCIKSLKDTEPLGTVYMKGKDR